MIALIRELFNDRTGDPDKSFDVIIRIALILIEALALTLLFNRPIGDSILLSCAVFFAGFDYLIHWIMIRKKVIELPRGESWFSWTGKTSAFDMWQPWVNLGKWGRFGVKAVVLIGANLMFWI
jgi:hypothetical protein